jgi:hypothetical protein
MFKETGLVGKAFPTFTALIRPFSSVNSLMQIEAGSVAKTFPTLNTLKWFFTSVNSLM